MIGRILAGTALAVVGLVGVAQGHSDAAEKPDCKAGLTVLHHLEDETTCDLNSGDTLAAVISRPDEFKACDRFGGQVKVLISLSGVGQVVVCADLDF